jgi:hypothetical protein
VSTEDQGGAGSQNLPEGTLETSGDAMVVDVSRLKLCTIPIIDGDTFRRRRHRQGSVSLRRRRRPKFREQGCKDLGNALEGVLNDAMKDGTHLVNNCVCDMLVQSPVLQNCKHSTGTAPSVRSTDYIGREVYQATLNRRLHEKMKVALTWN